MAVAKPAKGLTGQSQSEEAEFTSEVQAGLKALPMGPGKYDSVEN